MRSDEKKIEELEEAIDLASVSRELRELYDLLMDFERYLREKATEYQLHGDKLVCRWYGRGPWYIESLLRELVKKVVTCFGEVDWFDVTTRYRGIYDEPFLIYEGKSCVTWCTRSFCTSSLSKFVEELARKLGFSDKEIEELKKWEEEVGKKTGSLPNIFNPKMREWVEDLHKKIHSFADNIMYLAKLPHRESLPDKLRSLLRTLSDIADQLRYLTEPDAPRENLVTMYSCRDDPRVPSIIVYHGGYWRDNLIEYFRKLSDLSGRKVGFFIDQEEKPSIPMLLNDLANFFHIAAEELEKLTKEAGVSLRETEKIGICDLTIDAPEWMKALCEAMNTMYELRNEDFSGEDLGSVFGYNPSNNKLLIRVGSTKYHATEIEKKDDVLTVRYYDFDKDVVSCLKRLLVEYGKCICNINKVEGGPYELECECKPRENITLKDLAEKLGYVLARATSMDIRFDQGATCEEEEATVEYVIKGEPEI